MLALRQRVAHAFGLAHLLLKAFLQPLKATMLSCPPLCPSLGMAIAHRELSTLRTVKDKRAVRMFVDKLKHAGVGHWLRSVACK